MFCQVGCCSSWVAPDPRTLSSPDTGMTFLPNPPSISGRPNTLQITPPSISGRPNTLQITPPSISGRPNTLQITPPSISGRPNTLQITPPSISGRPNTLRITRRVFMGAGAPKLLRRVFLGAGAPKLLRRVFLGAGAPKLLRRSPPHFFRRSGARDELRRKRNDVLRDLPWAERLRREQCTRRRAADLTPRSVDEGLAVVVLRDKAEELAAAHVVGTHPAQRLMPDVLDFPCVSGRIAVGVQHLVALFPQCRWGGESCMHEHGAHRAVAAAWLRTRSRPSAVHPDELRASETCRRRGPRGRRCGACRGRGWRPATPPCPGRNKSRRQPTASRTQTPREFASQAGGVYHASTVAGRLGARAPGRHHAAGRSTQRGRAPPSRSDGN